MQLCREGACEQPDTEPCTEPEQGRCAGDVVRLCYAGRAHSIDCMARGLRCVNGSEGAECAALIAPEERCRGPVRCEGEVLLHCAAGRSVRTDCGLVGAACRKLPDAQTPSCVKAQSAQRIKPGCGPCGCPLGPEGELRCDGRDDDGDERVDETLSCAPIPVVAFVIADAGGNTSYTEDELRAELARANQQLAEDSEQPLLSFVLEDIVSVPDSSLLELSADELSALADEPRLHPRRTSFYVPVVFTDLLLAEGGVPRVGASTLANGFCGGVQHAPGPKLGLVAIGKARSSTTLLHELGHFLGLCHTHDLSVGVRVAASDAQGELLQACTASCQSDGDGVCDTAPDPGPDQCSYDAACHVRCARGQEPDVTNLMSYYTACRRRFSAQQRRMIEHTLALRRAWHPCLSADCRCELSADDCPVGMSCRPIGASFDLGSTRCELSGPRPARAACESHMECGVGSLCVGDQASGKARCARPCQESALGCTCSETSLGVRMCREDLG